eukprot:11698122-Ditylum_brightwellii.AAC.1
MPVSNNTLVMECGGNGSVTGMGGSGSHFAIVHVTQNCWSMTCGSPFSLTPSEAEIDQHQVYIGFDFSYMMLGCLIPRQAVGAGGTLVITFDQGQALAVVPYFLL